MPLPRATLKRPLFCPICGAGVVVPVEDASLPEEHRLPEHRSASGANLCGALVITVTIGYAKCAKCGRQMSKHPSGLCINCYSMDTTKPPQA